MRPEYGVLHVIEARRRAGDVTWRFEQAFAEEGPAEAALARHEEHAGKWWEYRIVRYVRE